MAGLLAAVMVRWLLGLIGRAGSMAMIVLVAPVVEEVAKTGLALFFGTDVFLTHMVFGGAELVTDSLNGRSIWPGLVALVLHSMLGMATAWLLAYAGVSVAVVLAVLLHGLWNYTAVRLL
jgi:hypothetical protein